MLFANFKYAHSYIRNVHFHKYCTAFYGGQILPLFNNCMDDVYISWRIAMCKVWRVPWTIHGHLLPHLAGVMDPELWFSDNIMVRTITNVDLNGTNGLNVEWRNVML